MYVESVANRDSPPAVLLRLREPYREDGKVRKRTLANLSCLPDEVIACGEQAIALRLGRFVDRHRMAKHFEVTITATRLTWQCKLDAIAQEAALDGIYVIRTSVSAQHLDAGAAVAAYKSLANVERAFRSMKTVGQHVRPVFHNNAKRVRAHVFLCMLAYYVEWHMRA